MVVKPGYKQTEVGLIPEEWGFEEIGALTFGNIEILCADEKEAGFSKNTSPRDYKGH